MREHFKNAMSAQKKILLFAAVLLAALTIADILAPQLRAQAPSDTPSLRTPQSQSPAGGNPSFDTATLKSNKSKDKPSANVQLDAGDVYTPTGGVFAAKNLELLAYIVFAYKLNPNQVPAVIAQLPEWTGTVHFDIDARARGNPSKDQLRQMLQSFLADRFKLAIHMETQLTPVFSMTMVKPGEIGPQLKAHSDDPPCAVPAAGDDPAIIPGGFPAICGSFVWGKTAAPGHMQLAARKMTMAFIGSDLGSIGEVGRPVLDRTGLYGTYDLIIDWMLPVADAQGNQSPAAFIEALKNQLGLQLDPQIGPLTVPIIDHIEQPTTN